MKKILKSLLYLIDKILKKDNIIIFSSYVELTDNSFAMYKYLKKNFPSYKCIWIRINYNNKLSIKTNNNIEIYNANTLKARYYFMKSKYVFATHGLYNDFPKNKNRKFINLWHGMPLKALGNLSVDGRKIETNYDVTISTSLFFRKIMAKVFGVLEEKVIVSGQPRNDLLFEKTNFFNKMKIDKKEYKQIFIWMPTYRSTFDSNSLDGKYDKNYISIIPLEKLHDLNKILKEKKYLLLIKLHPMDIIQKEQFEKMSNIFILKAGDLENLDEQLYPLLGSTDALITDYSSVWIDYEILNKPIFFVMDDYEEYKKTRGLLFENFIDISPYSIINSYESFIDFLENYEKIDLTKGKKTNKYNLYKDNKSCERIIKYLELK